MRQHWGLSLASAPSLPLLSLSKTNVLDYGLFLGDEKSTLPSNLYKGLFLPKSLVLPSLKSMRSKNGHQKSQSIRAVAA